MLLTYADNILRCGPRGRGRQAGRGARSSARARGRPAGGAGAGGRGRGAGPGPLQDGDPACPAPPGGGGGVPTLTLASRGAGTGRRARAWPLNRLPSPDSGHRRLTPLGRFPAGRLHPPRAAEKFVRDAPFSGRRLAASLAPPSCPRGQPRRGALCSPPELRGTSRLGASGSGVRTIPSALSSHDVVPRGT